METTKIDWQEKAVELAKLLLEAFEHPQLLDAGEVETTANLKKEYRDELLDEESCEYVESNFPEEKIKVQHRIAKAYFDGAFRMRDNVLFDVENHIEKPLKRELQASITAKEKSWEEKKAELEAEIGNLQRIINDLRG